MNKLTIIGNLTGDPELRTTTSGTDVCNFTVAVNRRNREGTDFFRVSSWGELAKACSRYLSKGKKVCVNGPVSVRAYTNRNNEAAASLEVFAEEIEFLSPKSYDELPE